MNKEAIVDHALSFKVSGMSENELSYLYDLCIGKTVLELGSMVGMSSYIIASVAQSLSCVDIWSENLDHLNHDPLQQSIYRGIMEICPNFLESFNKNCAEFIESGKIQMYRGNTKDLADNFEDKSFDIVLIDADHSYEGISQDFNLYKNKAKDDGFIVFHDYGDSMWTGIAKFCNEIVGQKELTIINRTERIGVFRKL